MASGRALSTAAGPVRIEHPEGSTRRGRSQDGVRWETAMRHAYGEFTGTMGVDGDPVDVFIGPDPDSPFAFVVHQHQIEKVLHWPGGTCPKCGEVPEWCGHDIDEDKVILGVHSEEAARILFLCHYNDERFLGPITKLPIADLRHKLQFEPGKHLSSSQIETPQEEMVHTVKRTPLPPTTLRDAYQHRMRELNGLKARQFEDSLRLVLSKDEPEKKTGVALGKSHVHSHQRKTPSGGMTLVHDYDDTRSRPFQPVRGKPAATTPSDDAPPAPAPAKPDPAGGWADGGDAAPVAPSAGQEGPSPEETPPTPPVEFKAAQDVTELENWCRDTYPAITWDLMQCDIGLANAAVAQFHKCAQLYPEAAQSMIAFGTHQSGGNGWDASDIADLMGQSTLAGAMPFETPKGFQSAIFLNPVMWSNPKLMKRCNQSGQETHWMPEGCGCPEAIISHEFGHVLHWNMERQFMKYFSDFVDDEGFGSVGSVTQSFLEHPGHVADSDDWKDMGRYVLSGPPDTWGEEALATAFAMIQHSPPAKWPKIVRDYQGLLDTVHGPAWSGLDKVKGEWDLNPADRAEMKTQHGYMRQAMGM